MGKVSDELMTKHSEVLNHFLFADGGHLGDSCG